MIKKIVFALGVCLLTACGGKKEFRVSVDVPKVGTQAMTVVYKTAGGERVVSRMPAIDGKFEFTGQSADTTMVEIFTAKKALFASFPVADGMDVELLSSGDSLYVAGSGLPVVTSFADSITASWPKFSELELVILHDSVATFPPEGIWFFSSSNTERSKAFLDSIRRYAKVDSPAVRDVFVSADLSQWRLYANRDSATWTQGLLPDAPLALRDILQFTPCLIEVDTAGTVLRVQRLE